MKLQILTRKHIADTIQLLSFLNPAVSAEILQQRYEKILHEFPHYSILGAYIGQKLVGLSGIWFGTKIWCGDYMEIDNLVVHPDYREKGVATALIDRIEAMAKEKHCNILVLDSYTTNYPSHRLYQRKGCEIWGFHFIKPLQDFAH